MCVFGVEVVLTNVDHRQFEELGQVHDFVEHTLAERAFSEETDRDAAVLETLR
jgi:hypothetical protein